MFQARFGRRVRLTEAAHYDRVFKQSTRSSDQYFTVLARPREQGQARLGLAISKRRVKLATSRNRIKRIVRESFRTTQQKYDADYVVMCGKAVMQATNQQLFLSLKKHWQNLSKKCAKF